MTMAGSVMTTANPDAVPNERVLKAAHKQEVTYQYFVDHMFAKLRIAKEDRSSIKPSLVFQVRTLCMEICCGRSAR